MVSTHHCLTPYWHIWGAHQYDCQRCHIKRHESSFSCITFHKCLTEDYHQKTFQSSLKDSVLQIRGEREDETPAFRTQTILSYLQLAIIFMSELCAAPSTKPQALLCCLFTAVWCEVMLARRGGEDEKQAKAISQKTLRPKALSSTPIFYAMEQSFPAGELITNLLAM